MIVQPASSASPLKLKTSVRTIPAADTAALAVTVAISPAGRAAAQGNPAPSNITNSGEKEVWTTDAAMPYAKNDRRLAALMAKQNNGGILSSSEMEYYTKATGSIDTMAYLSPKEKVLYDKLAAAGNRDAVNALGLITETRWSSGHLAGSLNGSYDAINTPITVANIEKYFSQSFTVSTGTFIGTDFKALTDYLKSNPNDTPALA